MKITSIKPHSIKVDITHPVDGSIVGWVEVIGRDSIAYRNAMRDFFKWVGERQVTEVSPAELEAKDVEILATCIINWGEVESEQNPDATFPPFSLEAVKLVLADEDLYWFSKQVAKAIDDKTAFFR